MAEGTKAAGSLLGGKRRDRGGWDRGGWEGARWEGARWEGARWEGARWEGGRSRWLLGNWVRPRLPLAHEAGLALVYRLVGPDWAMPIAVMGGY
jgi:hypothetical protein